MRTEILPKSIVWQSDAGDCNGGNLAAVSERWNTHRKGHAQAIRSGSSVCVSFSGPNKNPRVLPFIFPFTITAPR